MARHKNDADTARLLNEMDTTRQDLKGLIDGLLAEGTTKAEVARAAAWNPGYLTDFLENSEKRPTTRKIEALITALTPFVEASRDGGDLGSTLERLGHRYGIEIASLAAPTTGPIPASAPNFVRRTDKDHALELSCATTGDYAIDGQPMVGLSTALLYVEGILKAKGHFVRRLNAGTDLVARTYGRESKTGIMGFLAAALTESEAPLGLEFFGAQERLRAYLADVGGPFALLIDDVNQLERDEVEALKLLLRDWATRRAANEEPFTEVMTWTTMTSNVRNARKVSIFHATYTILRWFNRDEVRELADAFAPYSIARGVVRSSRWSAKVSEAAWSLFVGQPQLTHLFLWDRHLDGRDTVEDILTQAPSGSYKRHVDLLARSLTNLVGRPRAQELVAWLDSTEGEVSAADLSSAESLGLIDGVDNWSSPYYRAHLPKAVAVTADGMTQHTKSA
jgi:hypothetical protein